MSWLSLVCAGMFEVLFALSLKWMDGHKNIPWSIGFYGSMACSFFFLSMALRTIPIGTAYAVWTGIGTAGVATIGFCFLHEPLSFARLSFLVLLIVSIVGLKWTGGEG